MAVAGQPHIALDAVGALLQSELVGGQRVLGTVGRRAAVGHHERVTADAGSASPEFIRLCCRVLAFGLNRNAGFGLRFDASPGSSSATITQRCGRPLDGLALEAEEHPADAAASSPAPIR